MKKIIGCKKEIIIYFFALLITGLFFGNNIIQYQGKKAALIILLSITAAVIVLTILSKIFVNMIGQLAMGVDTILFFLFAVFGFYLIMINGIMSQIYFKKVNYLFWYLHICISYIFDRYVFTLQ